MTSKLGAFLASLVIVLGLVIFVFDELLCINYCGAGLMFFSFPLLIIHQLTNIIPTEWFLFIATPISLVVYAAFAYYLGALIERGMKKK